MTTLRRQKFGRSHLRDRGPSGQILVMPREDLRLIYISLHSRKQFVPQAAADQISVHRVSSSGAGLPGKDLVDTGHSSIAGQLRREDSLTLDRQRASVSTSPTPSPHHAKAEGGARSASSASTKSCQTFSSACLVNLVQMIETRSSSQRHNFKAHSLS